MKKIDKKCVDEIEKNKHLTGEDYASSILEDMNEFEIRGNPLFEYRDLYKGSLLGSQGN